MIVTFVLALLAVCAMGSFSLATYIKHCDPDLGTVWDMIGVAFVSALCTLLLTLSWVVYDIQNNHPEAWELIINSK